MKRFLVGLTAVALVVVCSATQAEARGRRGGYSQVTTYSYVPTTYVAPTYVAPTYVAPVAIAPVAQVTPVTQVAAVAPVATPIAIAPTYIAPTYVAPVVTNTYYRTSRRGR